MEETPILSESLYTEESVTAYLDSFFDCLRKRKFKICYDRRKNCDFFDDYFLGTEDLYNILLELNHLNFCDILINNNPRYPRELLYVFGIKKEFEQLGEIEEIELYIKVNVQSEEDSKFSIIISLHPAEYPMTYRFV